MDSQSSSKKGAIHPESEKRHPHVGCKPNARVPFVFSGLNSLFRKITLKPLKQFPNTSKPHSAKKTLAHNIPAYRYADPVFDQINDRRGAIRVKRLMNLIRHPVRSSHQCTDKTCPLCQSARRQTGYDKQPIQNPELN